jgi:hypothetical protein
MAQRLKSAEPQRIAPREGSMRGVAAFARDVEQHPWKAMVLLLAMSIVIFAAVLVVVK